MKTWKELTDEEPKGSFLLHGKNFVDKLTTKFRQTLLKV